MKVPKLLLLSILVKTVCACGTTGDSVNSVARSIQSSPSGVVGNTLCLNATAAGRSDTYQRIESVFGKGAIEAPSDAIYSPKRPHVREITADDVADPYFAVLAIEPTDVNLDLVPIANGGDRSRTEIKIAPNKVGVQTAFKAYNSDTFIYTWHFRIAPGMKFSSSFTHIHQIKAYGGDFAEPPLITFTPLSNGIMEVRHIDDEQRDSSTATVLGHMPLAGVAGQWIDVREEITYSNITGHYRLALHDEKGVALLNVDTSGLQMWRTGADHMRPKWGIYRKHHASLNQGVEDYIYFANFGVTPGTVPTSDCR